jgi:AGCS family alanine or glycine:cation symporter
MRPVPRRLLALCSLALLAFAAPAVGASAPTAALLTQASDDESADWQKSIDDVFGKVNRWIAGGYDEATGENAFGFFYGVPIPGTTRVNQDTGEPVVNPRTGKSEPVRIRLLILWLILGAVFFTVRMAFVNIRSFAHAIRVTRGVYDDPEDEEEGEVSHFQALTAALSATVGLGNIAGVAIAVGTGGPGATLWMIVAGVLGMSSKFAECSLGQMYRETRADGHIMGGAMFYLSKGLKEMRLAPLGLALAIMFAVMCIGGSFAGGNAFQVNQSLNALSETFPFFTETQWLPFFPDNSWVYGLIMTVAVGSVIIGGIRRIAATAEKIVPFMCGLYVIACLWILLKHFSAIPAAIGTIVSEAFTMRAGLGGLVGVLVVGFQRAAFSNEAGVGSAAIAHSAARTPYAVREGIVALLEPFIDTVVVCTMTALVIVITGAYDNPEYADLIAADKGAALTSRAFAQELSWFPIVLCVAVVLFAYSTMISWSYYGERCWAWMFGDGSSMVYRVIFLVFVFLGSVVSATNVLGFGDLMILGMAFPNILGVLLLSGKVRRKLDEYWTKLKAGEFETYK